MNILLTSAGRRTYLVNYFKHALNGEGKVYASNSIMTYTLTQADGYILTPNIYDERYISFLLDYCKTRKISAIISLFDIDLPILAKNKQLFADNEIQVIVSDYAVTQICNDKWATYNWLKKIGLFQTATFIDLSEAKVALQKGDITYPLILKPRWGMGSIGIYKACTNEELEVLYRKLHREIFDTYLKYESVTDAKSCVLIQEQIRGEEYGLEILNDLSGEYVATFAKKKIAMRSGETDIAETVDAFSFLPVSEAIAKSLRHIGNLDVDCFKADDGSIVVLEMNCRFGGQYPFTHNSGVDVPRQIVEWLRGQNTDRNLLNSQIGVRSCKELVPVVLSNNSRS
jgi:carbamoyl-phosphate synthase large subunit